MKLYALESLILILKKAAKYPLQLIVSSRVTYLEFKKMQLNVAYILYSL